MADILIRGLSMPHDCDECKLCAFIPVGEYGLVRKCMPLNRNAEITIRRKDCPLVELPEHGDLIDRSKLSPSFVCSGTAPMETDFVRRYYVDRMPVVIPSNKEDAE